MRNRRQSVSQKTHDTLHLLFCHQLAARLSSVLLLSRNASQPSKRWIGAGKARSGGLQNRPAPQFRAKERTMVSLLSERWMPVRRRDGSRAWIAPNQLSDPDILAFDADRPDFNGALAQFSVGLLQTSTPVDSGVAWDERFEKPPSAVVLSEWFAPFAEAFELDAKGACFMQDFSLTADEGSFNEIGALLIDAPGENALKNNSDHFVKRARVSGMCPHCAARSRVGSPAG
ncbi:MAG TPA: type I-E CRISPR-associated protein Cse1/CasA [Candidatus Accumulibacter sp.]|nr:type I-E CRISPR-associated protein Cse1/CasA [Accumulibacter sp.]